MITQLIIQKIYYIAVCIYIYVVILNYIYHDRRFYPYLRWM